MRQVQGTVEQQSTALACHLGASVSSTEGEKRGEKGETAVLIQGTLEILVPLESEPHFLPRDRVTAAEFASHFAIFEQAK